MRTGPKEENDEVYVLKNGIRLGPYSLDELLERVDRGEIDYEDLCLRDFAGECQRVREVLDWDDAPSEADTEESRNDFVEPIDKEPSPIESNPETEAEPRYIEKEEESPTPKPVTSRPRDPALILYSGHPSLVSFPQSLFALGISLGGGLWANQFSGWYLFFGLIFALFAISFIILERSSMRYVITPRRVEIEKGLFAKNSNEVLIDDIRTINVVRNGFLGIIGVGRVEFASSGGTEVEVAFENVWAAQRVKGLVRRLQDADI